MCPMQLPSGAPVGPLAPHLPYGPVPRQASRGTSQGEPTMRISSLILTIAALGAATATAEAQGRGKSKGNQGVPPGHRPPAGMCRIWIDNVPPGHQPAPTDCETAVRNQPPNSRIIWGDNTKRRDRSVADTSRQPTIDSTS